MPADFICDASVLGAAFFRETGTPAARRFLEAGHLLVAPELLWIEMASLAAKKVWRNEATLDVGNRAIEAVSEFVSEAEPLRPLTKRALDLAASHQVSAYDAAYLALAEARGAPVATLDAKLAMKASAAGLDRLIFTLT
jgi:predicted nucleic acid-binding protein